MSGLPELQVPPFPARLATVRQAVHRENPAGAAVTETFENSIVETEKFRNTRAQGNTCANSTMYAGLTILPEYMPTIILLFLILLVLYLTVPLIIRNSTVYTFRLGILKRIHQLNQQDINSGDRKIQLDRVWRYNVFNTAPYNAMVYKFWIPLKPECWYKDTSFLE
jgi:hypothetical protein